DDRQRFHRADRQGVAHGICGRNQPAHQFADGRIRRLGGQRLTRTRGDGVAPFPHLFTMTTGFTQQTVEAVTSGEPDWLKSQRLTAWHTFEKLPLPTKRDIEWQRFDIRALKLDKVSLPTDEPAIAERLTILPPELSKKGVIFCDMTTAVAKHGDALREYLGKSIAPDEPAKFSALHCALWRNGAFLYVP